MLNYELIYCDISWYISRVFVHHYHYNYIYTGSSGSCTGLFPGFLLEKLVHFDTLCTTYIIVMGAHTQTYTYTCLYMYIFRDTGLHTHIYLNSMHCYIYIYIYIQHIYPYVPGSRSPLIILSPRPLRNGWGLDFPFLLWNGWASFSKVLKNQVMDNISSLPANCTSETYVKAEWGCRMLSHLEYRNITLKMGCVIMGVSNFWWPNLRPKYPLRVLQIILFHVGRCIL